ncbi:hypothetical protein [Nocardiopsis quinghaiensis]|uniref:hypothetical protein n=1 Tax=Nocardiopsis quinghaiensis TaxID=464995 RepID=UPI001238F0C4|nr:hypothetical protein [Nocardiopsis quinghaiensis]
MSQTPEFGRRVIVTCDAKGYGSSDELTQHQIQEAIPAILHIAAEHSGLDRGEWHIAPGGDGEMAVLPVTVREPRLLDRYVPEIEYALRRHNHNRTEAGRLRLRLVVHHGSAVSSQAGYSGNGIVTAARVVDSDTLREALKDSGTDLVVAVTAPVYQDVVAQGHTRLRPEDFTLTTVRNKEYEEPVWVHVPGRRSGSGHGQSTDGTAGAPDGNGASPADPAPGAPSAAPGEHGSGPERRDSPAITNVMHGDVDASNAVFGVRY